MQPTLTKPSTIRPANRPMMSTKKRQASEAKTPVYTSISMIHETFMTRLVKMENRSTKQGIKPEMKTYKRLNRSLCQLRSLRGLSDRVDSRPRLSSSCVLEWRTIHRSCAGTECRDRSRCRTECGRSNGRSLIFDFRRN